MTSFRRHVPTRFLINQYQIIAFLILKSYSIQSPRTELRGIVLPVHSNQIKVTFIIILPFNLIHLWFFPVSQRNCRKMWMDYWAGPMGMLPPPSQIKLLPPPTLPTPMWNTSRYPYFDISDFQNWEKNLTTKCPTFVCNLTPLHKIYIVEEGRNGSWRAISLIHNILPDVKFLC